MSDFVEDFVEMCLDQDITKPIDITNEALRQRDEIDLKLEEFQKLREHRDNLTKVIRSLNPELKERKKTVTSIYPDLVNDDITDQMRDIIKLIFKFINETDKNVSSREVIAGVGWDNDEPSPVYLSIRFLLENGILSRNADRTLLKGPEWDNRDSLIKDN